MTSDELNKYIGNKIWEYREKLGVSRTQIANSIGVSHQQFEKYEKGLNRISIGTFIEILKHLNIETTSFLNDSKLLHLTKEDTVMYNELANNYLKIKDTKHRELILYITKSLATNN